MRYRSVSSRSRGSVRLLVAGRAGRAAHSPVFRSPAHADRATPRAVHRREIFDRVWADVSCRTAPSARPSARSADARRRRSARERFIAPSPATATSSLARRDRRRGRRRVAGGRAGHVGARRHRRSPSRRGDGVRALLERSAGRRRARTDEDRREAAELLHALGNAEALRRLGTASWTCVRAGAAARGPLGFARRRPCARAGRAGRAGGDGKLLRLRLRGRAPGGPTGDRRRGGGALAGIVAGGVGGGCLPPLPAARPRWPSRPCWP